MGKIIIYGIPNCDTIKKTLDWFKKNKIEFQFHDYKKEGITKAKLTGWSKMTDWSILLNKKGTTYKKLSAEEQEHISNAKTAINFMAENTSSIKRPVIEYGEKILVGFNETEYQQLFL